MFCCNVSFEKSDNSDKSRLGLLTKLVFYSFALALWRKFDNAIAEDEKGASGILEPDFLK